MDYRLKRKGDFDRVFKKGKKNYAKSLMLLYLPAENLKVGFSVGKKHGNAVTRNRIKRLLRAAVREVIPKVNGNYHIVFLPKVKEEYSFSEYLKDIKYLFFKEKIINDNK